MEKYLPAINKCPMIEKIRSSVPPEDLFSHFTRMPDTALLNSSLGTDAARYSFLGIEPFLALKGKGHDLALEFNGHNLKINSDPFDALRSIIDTYHIDNPTSFPLVAGGIGYLSYDLKNVLERLPQRAKDDLDLPDIYFVFYRKLLIRDRRDPDHLYVSIIDTDNSGRKGCRKSVETIKNAVNSVKSGTFEKTVPSSHGTGIRSNFTKASYIKAVRKVIDYIRSGDIYQACLSQRFRTKYTLPPYGLYMRLNRINPSPFSAYLNFKEAKIISSSPERFLRYADNILETRPMKGTRRRGKDPREDRRLKDELKNSVKDDAELSMIVDLERNDLGKVCVPGSIKVAAHRRIETYPTVFQTISIVKGRVNDGTSVVDMIKAAFPGGSISGCPKIRAMEIIDELEPTARGVYTGSIGYLSFHDTMDLNIAIRTMIAQGDDLYFQAGGGIVADSDPKAEYDETLDKAQALIKALGMLY